METNLLRRSQQRRAHDWISAFIAQDATPETARGLARWAGIESSGDPLALSPIGERGLLQCTKTTAKEGAFSDAEWAAFQSPNTPRAEHARLAVRFADWLWKRARRRIANPPSGDDDRIFYGKLYHGRPMDFVDAQMHGPARAMALDLAQRWKADPKRMRRLQAAAIAAWGVPA